MPLLMAFRRYWAIVFFAVLTLPTIGLLTPDLPAPMRTVIAPEARWWTKATERLDPYINNVFGFRGAVLSAHNTYEKWIGGSGSARVISGEGGALFLGENQALEQSIGQLVRPQKVEMAVDLGARLDAEMRRLGGRFVFIIPPNGHTANFDLLPAYARHHKRTPTEYDLVAEGLKTRGVPFVDLRPLIEAGKAGGPVYYILDTHWNQRGALIAFNAAMAAVGRPDLEIAAKDAIGAPRPRLQGDLLRMKGETRSDTPDVLYPPKAPYAGATDGLKPLAGMVKENSARDTGESATGRDPFVSHGFETGHDGPRIMVIGDSFTQHFWDGYLAARASAFLWMHHRLCRFDWEAIQRFKPDILVYAPTERFLPCAGQPGAK
ncbi:alginate O-acetyltransferase AlgX-related protein [Xanthobacter pseudotagetidis]|uniref:alginate O-acetyltransferase AlgX-related protein n=1 Tax=Xanthobacter pseudotagetidis TaxID=3119911 RepID=UPI003728170E